MSEAAYPSKSSLRVPLTYIVVGATALLLAAIGYLAWGIPGIGAGSSLRIFFEFYLGVLLAAMLGLAGIVALLIGIVAAGVRVGMRSAGRPAP